MDIYSLIEPIGNKTPLVVSSPHSGTAFPDDIKEAYHSEIIKSPDDTDWFIHQLYDFVPEMGATMICANLSRWVIDLNRDPESAPLYTDGRIITELCPTKSFDGDDLYKNTGPSDTEVERRISNYYWPYYEKIQTFLDRLIEEFGYALFWDAHSIRQFVPLIRKDAFPELILGDNDSKSANHAFSTVVLESLKNRGHMVAHNNPFKGGHLTRYFGQPQKNQHALQLEMTKVNYMDDDEKEYMPQRANRMRETLSITFENLLAAAKDYYE